MKKIFLFLFLLNKYSKTEKDRLEIFSKLQEKVSEEYSEQTAYGNVYNAYIEFLMSNKTLNFCVKIKDEEGLKMLKRGLDNSFDISIEYIKKEKI